MANTRRPFSLRAGIVLSLAALASAPGCSRKAETVDDVTIAVTTAQVRVGTLRDVRMVSGTVTPLPAGDFLVVAAQPGEVAELTKVEGDNVSAGDVLVRLEVPSITHELAARQLEMGEANSRLEKAKAEEARLKGLLDKGMIARNLWEAARTAMTAAEANITQAKGRLDTAKATEAQLTIRARFAGVVSKRWHNPGDLVTGGDNDPILRVVDPTKLQVVAQVPVVDAARIMVGQPATIQTLTGTEAATVSLKVSPVSATDAMTAVHLAFVAPTQLPIDTPIQAEIALEERKDVVVAPADALQRADGTTFYWVPNENNQATRREVRIGLLVGNTVQIISGLAVGDLVIITGISELSEGVPISIGKS